MRLKILKVFLSEFREGSLIENFSMTLWYNLNSTLSLLVPNE